MSKAERSHDFGVQLLETATTLRRQLGLEMTAAEQLSRHLETQWKLTWAGMQEKDHRLGVARLFHGNADELVAKLNVLMGDISEERPQGRNVAAVEAQLARGQKQVIGGLFVFVCCCCFVNRASFLFNKRLQPQWLFKEKGEAPSIVKSLEFF